MKFYAVKKGIVPGIYTNWPDCQKQVNGYSGAIYKSFKNREDAEAFLGNNSENIIKEQKSSTLLETKRYTINQNPNIFKSLSLEDGLEIIENRIKNSRKKVALASVDGSFDEAKNISSFGVVYKDKREELKQGGVVRKFTESRNVTGEVYGALYALHLAQQRDVREIYIYYDYQGIEKWANGEWKAKTPIAKHYVECLKRFDDIDVTFIKVKSHTGFELNETADKIASWIINKTEK